jgi:hypothetical protein
MSEAHTQRAHAKLAPSSAYRWIACPGSVRMSEGIEDVTSTYAAEGTAAHELAAFCLQNGHDAIEFLGWVVDTVAADKRLFDAVLGPLTVADGITRFEVDEEMVEAVQLYIDTVQSLIPKSGEYELDIETRLDMTHIHPDIFGTGDLVLYDLGAAWLHVLDFKYGKGVIVSPEENPQGLTYAAGAVRRYHNRPLHGITIHIVQPRAGGAPIKSWSTDPLLLMEFEDDLRAAALRTEEATRAYEKTRITKANLEFEKYLVAGDHCRFCKAAPLCPALRDQSMKDAMVEFSDVDGEIIIPAGPQLTPQEFGKVLWAADRIFNWIKAVQEHAHAEAMAGRTPPGFKLVAKRAVRKWRDEAHAEAHLMKNFGVDVMTEPKLKSPAQIEKALGKKSFAEFTDLVQQVSSGTNLVPISDPRPAVSVGAVNEFTG